MFSVEKKRAENCRSGQTLVNGLQALGNQSTYHLPMNAQWLATVLGQHFWFPVPLGIYLKCLYSPKSFVEFEFFAKRVISGSYGLENSQKFLKKAKNLWKF